MTLAPNAGALGPNRRTYFVPGGGVAPFTFAVLPGRAGGTVNASSGLYTAPSSYSTTPGQNYDIVQVTDSTPGTPLTATALVVIGGPVDLICDILQRELELAPGQVYIWDQKLFIPKDYQLYIAVGVVRDKPFGVSSSLNSAGDEVLETSVMSEISIDILSRSTIAKERKEEVLHALKSIYSQNSQSNNGFSIARLPTSFVDLSQPDGAAIPYRFRSSFNVQYVKMNNKAAPYFDTFEEPGLTTES